MTETELKPVPLEKPVKRGDTAIDLVQIRKPVAGDCRGLQVAQLQFGDVNSIIKIVPRISIPRLEEHEVAALDTNDFAEVTEIIAGFFTTSATRAYQPT